MFGSPPGRRHDRPDTLGSRAIAHARPEADTLSRTLHGIGQDADARADEFRALRRLPADIASWRWSRGSWLSHCNWVVGGVVVSDDGQGSAKRPDGLRTPIVFLPRTDVHLHDHWHTLGLQGSGSIDCEVNEVFVPEGCWVAFPMRAPVVGEPLYRFSTVGALAAGVAFVALGLARRAIDELILLATTKGRPAAAAGWRSARGCRASWSRPKRPGCQAAAHSMMQWPPAWRRPPAAAASTRLRDAACAWRRSTPSSDRPAPGHGWGLPPAQHRPGLALLHATGPQAGG